MPSQVRIFENSSYCLSVRTLKTGSAIRGDITAQSHRHCCTLFFSTVPAHGRNVALLDGGGWALADPAAVCQQRSLLLHLVQDLLPLRLCLRHGLLTLPLAHSAARHCAQEGRDKVRVAASEILKFAGKEDSRRGA